MARSIFVVLLLATASIARAEDNVTADNVTVVAPVAPDSVTCPVGVECKDKVILNLVNMLGLGILGIDRFYMGDIGLGVLKLLTLGGCGIWFIIDFIGITGNALASETSIDTLGFEGEFDTGGIDSAKIIAIVAIILVGGSCFCTCLKILCGGGQE